MPHWDYRVRRLFDSSVMYRWSTSSDDLPFYAQLHLTILAASAEESLQHEGNFEVRLAQMLDLQDGDYVSRGCLPALWENARQWSINRSEKRGDTRSLCCLIPATKQSSATQSASLFRGFVTKIDCRTLHRRILIARQHCHASSSNQVESV